MNRQIRVSDGAMFTYRMKKEVDLYNINLDFIVEMRDRFMLPNARNFFAKKPLKDHFSPESSILIVVLSK